MLSLMLLMLLIDLSFGMVQGYAFRQPRLLQTILAPTLQCGSCRPSRPLHMTTLRGHEAVSSEEETLLISSMKELGWDAKTQALLQDTLSRAGVSFPELLAVSSGCDADQIVRMLRNDFDIEPPLRAHQLRATLVHAMSKVTVSQPHRATQTGGASVEGTLSALPVKKLLDERDANQHTRYGIKTTNETTSRRPVMKSVHVNGVAARRKQTQRRDYEYSLNNSFPALTVDLDRFYEFMTRPSPYSQEDPIRPATASVYLRHAKLFLGWFMKHCGPGSLFTGTTVSLQSILPSSDKTGAAPFIDYIMWLRNERFISASYEANVLRGLTKLVKFRFAMQSESPTSSQGIRTYQDVPLVTELRKLHRVANRQQKLSPRSSNEQLKWLTWPEYLDVVESCRRRFQDLRSAYVQRSGFSVSTTGTTRSNNDRASKRDKLRRTSESSIAIDSLDNVTLSYSPQQREVAIALQRYLVLAIFASVPDRQRTIRELQVGKTLILDEPSGCYCIRHAPQDYKTGKTYGERPLLRLPMELTESIDMFWNEWRQCLLPSSGELFVQPRTGNPLTRDSVYQLVSRACFDQTGKRTNPHLLRDMIVTHVRECSNASEKELEALALFMGHSLQMQRTSYDRRTLSSKIAPAVQLLTEVNARATSQSESMSQA